jgi:hypothetical protein
MRVSRYLTLTLLLILAACSDSSEPTVVPPTFAVTPASQWAGGTVLVRSPFFDGLDSLPPVTAAGIEMVVTRVDDSTVSATLPSIPTQTAAVEVIDGATHYLVDSVGIVGFREKTTALPMAIGNPVLLQTAEGPIGIAGLYPGQPPGGIGLVNLRLAQTEVVSGLRPLDAMMLRGVGASYRPGTFILWDSTATAGEWQLLPTLAFIDTVPTAAQNVLNRNVARLSETVWLVTHNHYTAVLRLGAPTIEFQFEDPYAFHLSVPADRALMSGGGSMVLRMSTGDTLYRLPLTLTYGAAFSANGSTLYATGWLPSAGSDGVVALDAATGALQASAALPPSSSRAFGLALTAGETRLLILRQVGYVPEILVYDIGTMSLVGRLLAPESADCGCVGWLDAAVIADDATSTAYVLGWGHNSTVVWAFDMLP